MGLFVIGDLHLSFGSNKPMAIFGEGWIDHHEKIEEDWKLKVGPEDTVILPGDSSWAMTFDEAYVDLKWIDQLPGKKIVFKGNHDYWWGSIKKMTGVFSTIEFVHNSFAAYGDVAICGSRGWTCPNTVAFDENDEKIYRREAMRVENSILMAKKAGYKTLYGVLHYPPTNDKKDPSAFTEIFEKYEVKEVVYGHIHSKTHFKDGLKGAYNDVNYHLTSCDYLDFKLFRWL